MRPISQRGILETGLPRTCCPARLGAIGSPSSGPPRPCTALKYGPPRARTMSASAPQPIVPEIKSGTSDTHKRILVAGVFGGARSYGLEVTVYSEQGDYERVLESQPLNPARHIVRRTIEATLVIDPMQMKSIHDWLGKNMAEYERMFGKIPSPEEVRDRSMRDPMR